MIGIFDSGFGGLTIMQALMKALPEYSYTYLGDSAHAPYGEKSAGEIVELTQQGVEFLFSKGSKIAILGCNTASAAALRELQQTWLPKHYPDRHLLGIVVPTVEQITGADWRHESPITTPISADMFTVGVLATPATVATQAYSNEIHKRNASIRVLQQACPGLAAAIERDEGDVVEKLVQQYVHELVKQADKNLHAVLLGCTHFELIAATIATELPSGVRLYHQPSIVAESFGYYLNQHHEITGLLRKEGRRKFFTTSNPEAAMQQTARYMGASANFKNLA